jgi:putative ABC transport system permease protein
MSLLRSLAGGLRGLFRKEQVERELDEELRGYLEAVAAEKMKSGMSREEALRAARLEMGSSEGVKENVRTVGWETLVETVWQDLRFGARMLRKSPGFTTVAVLTLALGIGASTTMFSVVNSVLLRPLAYPESQQLYLIREIVPQMVKFYPTFPANLSNFRTWQKECRSFDGIAIAEGTSMTLTGRGPAEQIAGGRASANLFDVLGVRPRIGRTFLPEEDQPGRDHVVILTDSYWRSRFDGDTSVVGSAITLDGVPYTVIGILPPSFYFHKEMGPLVDLGSSIGFFKPLGMDPANFGPLGEFDFAAIARLKSGVELSAALTELNVVQAQIAHEANEGVDLEAQLIPLNEEVVGTARDGLMLLLAAVGAVLLIVCVNLANLLLSRAPARMREAAIRNALGASRGRLVRQMLAESLLLGVWGGTLGICLARLGMHWFVQAAPANLPRLDEVTIDARVLVFSALLVIFTSTLFGVLPAWRMARVDPQRDLKSSATAATENRRTRRLRQTLIGLEVGLTTLLLIVAGLLTTSLVRVLRVNAGFITDRVLAADIQLPPQNYSQPAARDRFYAGVLAGMRALPGVHSAGWVSILPLGGQGAVCDVSLPGDQVPVEQRPLANFRVISPGYLKTIGIPLLRGRSFTENDRGQRRVIISQNIAERFWPGKDPVGQKCVGGWGQLRAEPSEVIGVVGDIRTTGLDEPPLPMVYVPDSYGGQGPGTPSSASIVVRTDMDPDAVARAVRGVIQGVDPDVPVVALRPMKQIVSESVSSRRFQMFLTLLFAGSALLLAALGIFGVLAYSIAQRHHELGIRMALGAEKADLLALVVRQGMAPVLCGFIVGAGAALFAGHLIRSLLFGVTPFDPLTFLFVTVAVVLTALAACYIPARRAMRVDPMVALRYE